MSDRCRRRKHRSESEEESCSCPGCKVEPPPCPEGCECKRCRSSCSCGSCGPRPPVGPGPGGCAGGNCGIGPGGPGGCGPGPIGPGGPGFGGPGLGPFPGGCRGGCGPTPCGGSICGLVGIGVAIPAPPPMYDRSFERVSRDGTQYTLHVVDGPCGVSERYGIINPWRGYHESYERRYIAPPSDVIGQFNPPPMLIPNTGIASRIPEPEPPVIPSVRIPRMPRGPRMMPRSGMAFPF